MLKINNEVDRPGEVAAVIDRPRVAIAEGAYVDIARVIAEYSDRADFVVGPVGTPEQVRELTQGVSGLAVSLHPLRSEHIAALSDSVKVISRAGVGLDTIDLAAARERGIPVVYQPNYATNEVADHAATMALAAWRRTVRADRLVREQDWASATEVGVIGALQDATLGVLGAGRIGRAVIERLRPFVRRVVVFDTFRSDSLQGVEWMESAGDVLDQANLLTLHLPLLDSTRHIIDAQALARMPIGATIVNVSRGGLIDEVALADALLSGSIRSAGLDVFENEPLQKNSPLRDAPNLTLSPHLAWYSDSSGARLALWSAGDVVDFLTKGSLTNGAWAP